MQAGYWADVWAKQQGKGSDVSATVGKAAKMGDYLRYAMYDKYFKKIGNCVGPSTCAAGTGKDASSYLLSWYYAWGGATDTSAGWDWRIGSSHVHGGYQNPLAAYALAVAGSAVAIVTAQVAQRRLGVDDLSLVFMLAVLTVANLAVTVGRFVAMRTWVFVRHRRPATGCRAGRR